MPATSDFEGKELIDLFLDIVKDSTQITFSDERLEAAFIKALEVLADELNSGNFEPAETEAFNALANLYDNLSGAATEVEEVAEVEVEEEDDDDEIEEDDDDDDDDDDTVDDDEEEEVK